MTSHHAHDGRDVVVEPFEKVVVATSWKQKVSARKRNRFLMMMMATARMVEVAEKMQEVRTYVSKRSAEHEQHLATKVS